MGATRIGTGYVNIIGNFAPLRKSLVAEQGALSTRLAAIGKAGSLAVVGIGIAAAKMSIDFRHQMRLISTQAGATNKEVKKMRGSVLDLAKKTIFAPEALARALFHVESAGYKGAKALEILNSAQKLATVGDSDLEQTTYALVSAEKTGIQGTKNLHEAISTLNGIVGTGDLRMQDLVGALGTGLLPAAENASVSLRDIGAALDVMTVRGQPARLSATRLRMTLSLLGGPTDQAIEQFKSIGIGQLELARTMEGPHGLVDALTLLHDHLSQAGDSAQQAQLLTKAFGGGRSSAAIRTLVDNVGDLQKRYQRIGVEADKFNKDLKEAKADPLNRIRNAWVRIETVMISIAQDATPAISKAIQDVSKVIADPHTGFFGKISDLSTMFTNAVAALAPKAAEGALVVGAAIAKGMVEGFIHSDLLGQLAEIATFILIFGGKAKLLAVGAAIAAPIAEGLGFSMLTVAGEGTLFTAFGRTFAFSMGEAVATAIPIAFAGFGIFNIIMKAIKGDIQGAALGTLGAGIGAAIGGAIGGPLGAAVGVGVGSIGGTLLSSLISDKSIHKWTKDHFARVVTSDSRDALKKALSAGDALDAIKPQHNDALKRRAKATEETHKSEKKLIEDMKRYGPLSEQVAKDTNKVTRSRKAEARANREVQRTDRESAAVQKVLVKDLKQSAGQAKASLRLNNQRHNTAVRQLKDDEHAQKNQKVLNADVAQVDKTRKAAADAQDRLNKTYAEASKRLSPQFQKEVHKDSDALAHHIILVDHTAKELHNKYTKAIQGVGPAGHGAAAGMGFFETKLQNVDQEARQTIRGQNKLKSSTESIGPSAKKAGDAYNNQLTAGLDKARKGADHDVKGVIGLISGMTPKLAKEAKKQTDNAVNALHNQNKLSDSQYRKLNNMTATAYATSNRIATSKSGATAIAVAGTIKGMVDAVSGKGGYGTLQKNLNAALSSLGVGGKKVHWTAEAAAQFRGVHGATAAGGQTGGMGSSINPIVPGHGVGDKVPAMLEPKEYVVNSKAAMKYRGLLDSINFDQAPRFKKGGMVFPLQGNFTWGRTDMGVDFGGTARIAAMGDAVIQSTGAPGWPGGGGVVYRLLSGAPNVSPTSPYIYNFEHVTPTVHPGQKVKAGQVIGNLLAGFPGLEMGFATASSQALAAPHYSEGDVTAEGSAMLQLLKGLSHGKFFGGVSVPQLKRILLKGPKGPQKTAGQATLDTTLKRAQTYLNKSAPADSFGNIPQTSGQYSKQKLVQLWGATGHNGDPNIMAAIALAESGGNPAADNGIARGLWQIISGTWDAYKSGQGSYDNAFDPESNAIVAHAVLAGSGLGAWDTYTSGAYQQFLQSGGLVQMLQEGGMAKQETQWQRMLQNHPRLDAYLDKHQHKRRTLHRAYKHSRKGYYQMLDTFFHHHPRLVQRGGLVDMLKVGGAAGPGGPGSHGGHKGGHHFGKPVIDLPNPFPTDKKGKKRIKKLVKKIKKLGRKYKLSDKTEKALSTGAYNVEYFDELAQRAETLTPEFNDTIAKDMTPGNPKPYQVRDEDDNVIGTFATEKEAQAKWMELWTANLAKVKEKTEPDWLNTELKELGGYRNVVIGAGAEAMKKEKLAEKFDKKIKGTIDRWQHQIKQFTKRSKDLRNAPGLNKHLQSAKNDAGKLKGKTAEGFVNRISGATEAFGKADSAKKRTMALKQLHNILQDLRKYSGHGADTLRQYASLTVEKYDRSYQASQLEAKTSALKDKLLPALKDREGHVKDSASGLKQKANDLVGKTDSTLVEIQGLGGPTHRLRQLPPYGVLGGEIFDVEQRLHDLKALLPKTDVQDYEPPAALDISGLVEFANLVRAGAFSRDAFGTLPSFHTGGTYRAPYPGGEGLALLKDRETILPPDVNSANGGGDVYLTGPLVLNGEHIGDVVDARLEVRDRKTHMQLKRNLRFPRS